MQADGHQPSLLDYEAVLTALAKAEQLDQARMILEKMLSLALPTGPQGSWEPKALQHSPGCLPTDWTIWTMPARFWTKCRAGLEPDQFTYAQADQYKDLAIFDNLIHELSEYVARIGVTRTSARQRLRCCPGRADSDSLGQQLAVSRLAVCCREGLLSKLRCNPPFSSLPARDRPSYHHRRCRQTTA